MRTVASPSSPAIPVRVAEEGGIRALARMAIEWDGLVSRSAEPAPFLRASFLRAWWRAFGRGRPRLVLVRDGEGRLAGGALFAQRWGFLRGIPVRELALAANVHSNRAGLVAELGREREVGVALARWACEIRHGWSLLRLDGVPADSGTLASFAQELDRLGFRGGSRPAHRSPWIALDRGWSAFEATLTSKWKSNLRNREKRIAALGPLAHETVTSRVPDLPARLEACFALEAKAWKGSAGSAIESAPATRRFYRALARGAARDGSLRLHTLRAGGMLIAFQLDLEEAGVEYVLKIGYEPSVAKLSPGALLLKRVIEAAAAHGVSRLDLLGDDMPWKRDWTAFFRPHVRFLSFGRGLLGRALHALEFRAVPFARSILRPAVGRPLPEGTP